MGGNHLCCSEVGDDTSGSCGFGCPRGTFTPKNLNMVSSSQNLPMWLGYFVILFFLRYSLWNCTLLNLKFRICLLLMPMWACTCGLPFDRICGPIELCY